MKKIPRWPSFCGYDDAIPHLTQKQLDELAPGFAVRTAAEMSVPVKDQMSTKNVRFSLDVDGTMLLSTEDRGCTHFWDAENTRWELS